MLINSCFKEGYIISTLEQGPDGDHSYGSNLSLTSAPGKLCAVDATGQPVYPREFSDTHFIGGWVDPRGRSGRV